MRTAMNGMSNLEETSREAEPDKDIKLTQSNEITLTLSIFGALSMRQISELTNIPYTSVTWRFSDDRNSENPMWKQVGTFPINGRRYKIFDLIKRSEWIGCEVINKEFYEYLENQKVKVMSEPEKFESYTEICPVCKQQVWVQQSKNGNLYYTQYDSRKKNYKELPNWHSEYCKGRPKQIKTVEPKDQHRVEKTIPKTTIKTALPRQTITPETPIPTAESEKPGKANFQVNRLELSEEEKVFVERSPNSYRG